MTVSDWAAWYAAAVATLALWLQWFSGRTRLTIRAKGGMIELNTGAYGLPLSNQREPWVVVSVDHAAGPATTVQAVSIYGHTNWRQRLWHLPLGGILARIFRADRPTAGFLPSPSGAPPLPHALGEGGTMRFWFRESELAKFPGVRLVAIEHTRSQRPALARVVNVGGSRGAEDRTGRQSNA